MSEWRRESLNATFTMDEYHDWESYFKGITDAIMLQFATIKDRDFYLLKDQLHHALSTKAALLIADSVVGGKTSLRSYFSSNLMQYSLTAFQICWMAHWLVYHLCRATPILKQENSSMALVTVPNWHFKPRYLHPPPFNISSTIVTRAREICEPFACNVAVRVVDATVICGSASVHTYTSASGKSVRCHYCPTCGAHVYHVQEIAADKAILRTLLLDNQAG